MEEGKSTSKVKLKMLIEMLLIVALLKKSFSLYTVQVATTTIDCIFQKNLEGEAMALFSTLLLVFFAAAETFDDQKIFLKNFKIRANKNAVNLFRFLCFVLSKSTGKLEGKVFLKNLLPIVSELYTSVIVDEERIGDLSLNLKTKKGNNE